MICRRAYRAGILLCCLLGFFLLSIVLVKALSIVSFEKRTFPEKFSVSELDQFAKSGDAWAMFRLAIIYGRGDGVEQSDKTSRAWLEAAANANYQPAMNALALAYLNEGGEKNRDLGVAWLEKAASLHYGVAMFNLGAIFVNEKEYEKAKLWFERGSREGNLSSLRTLAYLYGRGQGVKKDCAEALRLLRKAIDGGDDLAPDMFHFLFRNGRDAGKVTLSAKSIVGTGEASAESTITTTGEPSFCGESGKSGDVSIEAKKILDWNIAIRTDGVP